MVRRGLATGAREAARVNQSSLFTFFFYIESRCSEPGSANLAAMTRPEIPGVYATGAYADGAYDTRPEFTVQPQALRDLDNVTLRDRERSWAYKATAF